MDMRRIIIGILILLSYLPSSYASKEGALQFSAFTIKSPGIGSSGPVTVTGERSEEGFSSLNVAAFGKSFVLNSSQLAQLRSLSVNGIQISYETGYPQFGGKTIYLVFSKGFTSSLRESRLVTVKERGDINVTDNTQHK